MMTSNTFISSCRIGRRAVKQGSRSSVRNQAENDRYVTDYNDCNASKSLLKCKKPTIVTTFNARSLTSISKLGEITELAERYTIDIMCIQEHRMYHEDDILKYHDLAKGWKLVTSSCVKNSVNASIGGVGLIMSPKATKALLSIETINERIMIATFNGNPKATVISCYSPTNAAAEEEVEDFYQVLSSLVKEVPKHNVKIIGGDMNAKLSAKDINGYTYHKNTNRNGNYLIDFLSECNLHALNCRYQKKRGKLYTFTYPNGTKAQIDYIFVNNKWRNSGINCEAYDTFYPIGSDHRPISATFKLSLRANKCTTVKKKLYG